MERCLACEAEGSWGVPLFLRRPARLLDYEGQVARPRREALPFTNHQSPVRRARSLLRAGLSPITRSTR